MDLFPKTYEANMALRIKILERCRTDLEYRAYVKELFHKDILFSFNVLFYTLDPRRRPFHDRPFCTYEFQDKFLLELCSCIDEGRDIPVEKSRDMGVSWMVVLTFVWYWLKPEGGMDFLLGSRAEDYVDSRGDMRTLFEKARYALRRLPAWLMPEGFLWKKHDNFCRLVNPATGSAITGESNNDSFSTAGRYIGIMFDEQSKWKNTDKAAWTAAGDATPCRIPVSTPSGAFGQFYEITHDPTKKIKTLHWSLHPLKSIGAYCRLPKETVEKDFQRIRSPWFDNECKRRAKAEIAQELQISYLGAGRPEFAEGAAEGILYYMNLPEPTPEMYDLKKECFVPHPGFFEEFNDNLLIYNPYNKDMDYLFVSDVAEGKNDGDFSTIFVLNRITMDIDAVHHAKTDENALALYLIRVANMYGRRQIVIETVGPGLATFDRVVTYGYTNLYMTGSFDKAKQSTSFRKGWYTGKFNRPLAIASVREYLEARTGSLNYPRIAIECSTFHKNKDGKPEAKAGCNDDLVMTLGIGLEVHSRIPIVRSKTKKTKSKYLGEVDLSELSIQDLSMEERCLKQVLQKVKEKRMEYADS